MADTTLVVHGLRELNRDFGRISKKLQREFQREIRTKLAEPVAEEIRRLASGHRWGAWVTPGVRPGSRLGGAVVRQTRRRTTGTRPDFGALQMRQAFIPGLDANEEATVVRTEEFLARITAENGFGLGGLL